MSPQKHAPVARNPKARLNGQGSEFSFTDAQGRTVYRAVETFGRSPEGRQVIVSGQSRTSMADARLRLRHNRLEKQIALGQAPPDNLDLTTVERALTLATWFEIWLPRQDIRASTRSQYKSRIRLWLNPKFGATPLRLLRGEDVVAYFRDELPALRKPDGTPLLGGTSIRDEETELPASLVQVRPGSAKGDRSGCGR